MASYSGQNSEPSFPLHLCFFLLTLFMLFGFTWYLNYEPIMESLMDQLKLALMVSPLVLLLVLHLVTNYGDGGLLSSLIPLPERDSLHRAGGTPWGVGLVLVVLLFMVSYQSSFQERWFPLLSRFYNPCDTNQGMALLSQNPYSFANSLSQNAK
ncbi:hypothetical protein PIB30_066029 [Stylosanthes scabra]|uniref:Uncharacterized protein n=1 Tax=Stylosanthes scabra TaxID=79078 RepID=A0ABU6RMF6_9FABA|nr:hypothetical protein [Stylosanthes scabra]